MWFCGVAWHLLFRWPRLRSRTPEQPRLCTPRAISGSLGDADRRDMTGFLEHREPDLLRTFEAEAPQTGEQLVAAHVLGLERILDHATIDDERARLATHELAQYA